MGNRKHVKENLVLNKSTMPPILTIGMGIFLISFIMISRGLIHETSEEISIACMSSAIVSNSSEINESERTVLTILWSTMKLSGKIDRKEKFNSVYYKTLNNYLSSSGVNLNALQAKDIIEKINDLADITNYEWQTDFSKMSLDVRQVALYLTVQIYKICGLHIIVNMEGNIGEILDKTGNIIYKNNGFDQQTVFKASALFITLAFAFVLLSLCIIIARKNQLFGREVIYDGFDEERFA